MKLLSWGISEALADRNPTRAVQLVADHFGVPLPDKILDERTDPRGRHWISIRIYHASNIYIVSRRDDGFVEDVCRYGWLLAQRATIW